MCEMNTNPLPSFTRRVAHPMLRVLASAVGVPASYAAPPAPCPAPCPCPMPHPALFQVVLQQVAPVVHRLRRLDLEIRPLRQLVNLAEHLLELLAAQQIVQLPAAHRNQEKHVPHHDRELLKQIAQVVEIVRVVAADGGVHLDRNPRLVGPLDGLDRPRPCSRQSAKRIVNLRRRAVQRNPQPHQPSFFHLENRFARQQRRGARRHRHLHALARRVADQLETDPRASAGRRR